VFVSRNSGHSFPIFGRGDDNKKRETAERVKGSSIVGKDDHAAPPHRGEHKDTYHGTVKGSDGEKQKSTDRHVDHGVN
jgi:hypothetical protein